MKRGPLCLMLFVFVGLSSLKTVFADRASEGPLNAALSLWRAGDVVGAEQQLTSIIDGGTEDSRVFYFRGILSENAGHDGTKDFSFAAKLEAATGTKTLINRALEKVQGPVRGKIEKIRASARDALKPHPEAARLKSVYREALEARNSGEPDRALTLLKEVTTTGTDPRFFYMYGVALFETGHAEGANAAFAEGLKHEKTLEDTHLVSIALAEVQGEPRRLIEEQTLSNAAGEVLTRQTNAREIQRRASMSQDQLLADANLAATSIIQQREQQQEARRLAAAAAIIAENKAEEELQTKLSERPIAAVPKDDAAPVTEEMPAEEAAVAAADPAAAANPFLSGAKAGSATGSIDMSWMPASTDYLTYVRPADMLNSGFGSTLSQVPQFQEGINKMTEQSGLAAVDIESITAGVGNMIGSLMPIVAQAASGNSSNAAELSQSLMSNVNSMAVIRTNKEIDIVDAMSTAKATKQVDGDTTYYLLPKVESNPSQMALYAVDSMTFLMGSESAVKVAVAAGPGEPDSELFSFVSPRAHLVLAFSSPLMAAMSGSIPDAPPQSPPMLGQFVSAVKGKIAGGAFIVEAGTDLKVTITLNLTEESAATEGGAALSEGVQMAKQMAPFALGQAPQEIQPSLVQAVGTLAASNAGEKLNLSINIPGSLAQAVKDNPQLIPAAGPGAPTAPAP